MTDTRSGSSKTGSPHNEQPKEPGKQRQDQPGQNPIKQRGEALNPLSRLPQQAVQSEIGYQPWDVFLLATSIAARPINANR